MTLSSKVGMIHVSGSALTQFVQSLLMRVDVPSEDAVITAHVLVDADMTGRHTHGVSRLPLYMERILRGVMTARPNIHIESGRFPTAVAMDGGNGLGPVIAWRAMQQAVHLSAQYGVGIVAVKGSNHAGAMGVYCEEAAKRGHIFMALTNSPPGIPPWGGRTAFLGTNPIAYGIPRGSNQPPIIVDLATSVVARGHIIQAARLKEQIPPDWAIDDQGYPTTDPAAALRGAVLPMAGPKGYALALVVEILSGVFSGAGVGPEVKNPYNDFSGASNVGHFFWALNSAAFEQENEFFARLVAMEEAIHGVPTMPGQTIRLPGDRAHDRRQDYQEQGIPIDPDLFHRLNTLAEECEAPRLTSIP